MKLFSLATPTLTGNDQSTRDTRTTFQRLFTWLTHLPLSVLDYGADSTGTNFSDTAFSLWFADVIKLGKSGYIPAGTYKFQSQQYWNLTTAATKGVRIYGDGVQNSILDFTGCLTNPNLLIGGSIDLFYVNLAEFGVKGSISGVVVQFGHEDFSDPINEAVIDLVVSNHSTDAAACAIECNYVLNSRSFSAVANCAGHGVALRLRQAEFNTFLGSFGNADIGVHFPLQYGFGNVFAGVDIETVSTCVQFDGSANVNNIFLGGQYVWSTTAIVANSGSNYNRFVCANFAVGGTILTGALSATVLISDKYIGVEPLGGFLVSPPSGDGSGQLDSVAGNSAFLVYRHAGVIRWVEGRENSTEAGGNSGSNWQITRFDDNGTAIDNPISIDRASGHVTVLNALILATNSILSHASGGTLGVFGAIPRTQPDNTVGTSAQNSAGSVNATFQDTTFTGGIGATAYTIGELIGALKSIGVIKS